MREVDGIVHSLSTEECTFRKFSTNLLNSAIHVNNNILAALHSSTTISLFSLSKNAEISKPLLSFTAHGTVREICWCNSMIGLALEKSIEVFDIDLINFIVLARTRIELHENLLSIRMYSDESKNVVLLYTSHSIFRASFHDHSVKSYELMKYNRSDNTLIAVAIALSCQASVLCKSNGDIMIAYHEVRDSISSISGTSEMIIGGSRSSVMISAANQQYASGGIRGPTAFL